MYTARGVKQPQVHRRQPSVVNNGPTTVAYIALWVHTTRWAWWSVSCRSLWHIVRPACLPGVGAICSACANFFVVIPFRQLGLSQDLLVQFSPNFHHVVGTPIVDYWLVLIFRSLKGRCYGNQLLRSKSAKSAHSLSFVGFALQNELEYRNSDFKMFNGNLS